MCHGGEDEREEEEEEEETNKDKSTRKSNLSRISTSRHVRM